MNRAMLVVGHGSRDADGVDEFWAMARTIRAAAGELLTGFGFIELASPTVDEAIDDLVARGATEIVSVPLVLLAARPHWPGPGPGTRTCSSAWLATWASNRTSWKWLQTGSATRPVPPIRRNWEWR
jgi:hypothetical protein